MHLRCKNCGHASHASNFLEGGRCVRCRGRSEPLMQQAQEFYAGVDAAAAEAETMPQRDLSASLPLDLASAPAQTAKSLSTAAETVSSTVSDVFKVTLVVGGALAVFAIYNVMRTQREAFRVVPELVKAVPFI